jgi:hypothetical protein
MRRSLGTPSQRVVHCTVALFCVLAGLVACQTRSPVDPSDPSALLHPSGSTRAPVIIESDDPRRWPADAYSVLDASVEAGVLTLRIQFGGGCEEHRFALVVTRLFLESYPVQIPARLAHDAKGDTCRAVVQETVRFDLTPVRQIYQQAYGTPSDTLVLVLDGRAIRYSF